jgi:hypothetical protein
MKEDLWMGGIRVEIVAHNGPFDCNYVGQRMLLDWQERRYHVIIVGVGVAVYAAPFVLVFEVVFDD